MKPAAPSTNCKPPESVEEESEIQGNGPTNEDTAALDSLKMSQVEDIRYVTLPYVQINKNVERKIVNIF